MAAANPLPSDHQRVRVTDDREAVQEIARRAEELAAKGLRGEEFLLGLGIDEEEEPSVTVTSMEELDAVLATDDQCVPSS
jgi:hypothetical protein